MLPMVSVIIPTFNRSYCLPLAISSVLVQSYKKFEVIIVDDNSTDNTSQICRKFGDEFGDKIQYIRNEKNLGPSSSRNIGIDLAKGKYITFLDSDDLYYLDKIQLQVELMERDSSIGFCYGHFATTHDIFDRSQFRYHSWNCSLDLYPTFLLPKNYYVVTPAVMLRADLLRRTSGFDCSLKICEDLELWSRILLETRAACITKPIVVIHVRNDENIRYMDNILARDQLYERVFSRDHNLKYEFRKRLYSDLVDVYLYVAMGRSSPTDIVDTLKEMCNACKMPYEAMRSEIIQLAKRSNGRD